MRTARPAIAAAAIALLMVPARVAHGASDPPSTVPRVDLDRYAGQWYEIARFPNRFQRTCDGDVVVFYARRPDGRIDVDNRCRRADGATDRATGVARVVAEDGSNSKLEVRFAPAFLSIFPFAWGDYWILALADDYSWAAVGDPSYEYLWILSRAPTLPEDLYDRIAAEVSAKGFDVSGLQRTTQSGEVPPANGQSRGR